MQHSLCPGTALIGLSGVGVWCCVVMYMMCDV
jgi:hypothetical protein